MSAVPEVVEFLLSYPPFSALSRAEVENAAASAEIEFHLAGTEIFSQGAQASEVLRVIRAGAVEIVHDGAVRLAADVVARTSGGLGEYVTIFDPQTQRALSGVVTGPNTVELTLPGENE